MTRARRIVSVGSCIVTAILIVKHKHDERAGPIPAGPRIRCPLGRAGAAAPRSDRARAVLAAGRGPGTFTGRVPTPELREAAIRLLLDRVFATWPSAQIEDRIVVEPRRSARPPRPGTVDDVMRESGPGAAKEGQ